MAKDSRGVNASNKYRDSTYNYLTKALFWETNVFSDRAGCLFTLKSREHKGFPSLHLIYMEMQDPTEYSFALECFEGWEHWNRICNTKWFAPYIEAWRQELAVKLASQGLATIVDEVKSGGKGALVAAKYLVEKGWVPVAEKPKRPRGRPPKEAVKTASGLTPDIEEAATRILN